MRRRYFAAVWGMAVVFLLVFGRLAAEPATYSGQWTIGYDPITLPKDEPMGLMHAGALFDLNRYIRLGPELYGAVRGERGGFFTVGMSGEFHRRLVRRLEALAGLYVGAGGGGAAPQGGGLMLRPRAALRYDLGRVSVEAGISRVWFPNGDIDSTQFAVALQMPFGGRFWRGIPDRERFVAGGMRGERGLRVDVRPMIEHYQPVASAHSPFNEQAATEPYTLGGIAFLFSRDSTPFYGYVQTAGAGAGKATGYMEVFGGIGYRYSAFERLTIGIQGALGAGGGGRIDTGGGAMYRAEGVVDARIFRDIHLGVQAGYIGAFGGSFSATSAGVSVGYRHRFFGLGDPAFDGKSGTTPWRFRLLNKSYLPADGMFNDDQKNRIDLIGVGIDRFVTPHLYISGLSYWAWQGQAGGYAEGAFALGWESGAFRGWRAYAEAVAGVGGGGDVHMDGGLFGAIGGGVRYDIDDAWQLDVGAEYVRSRTGGFRTTSLKAGVNYRFSLFGE